MSSTTNAALAKPEALDDDERMSPGLQWERTENGQEVTIRILLGKTEQERFCLPDWDPLGDQGPPLLSWLSTYYQLSEQERRDRYQGRFEKYVEVTREAEQSNSLPEEDEEVLFRQYLEEAERK
ncbi:hypothetical protein GQ44DRAFT_728821 [Phaeosphaeriaceae sp. PMI808]|nr:hypothetical protein GQ44DRAFT_779667 [Phaeosphaeriaceae sp. PMI808]KAH8723336.1 hypothetical protein GQ44DRAFT_728821 [Phaeosphaeriaceae sp. PMI808]